MAGSHVFANQVFANKIVGLLPSDKTVLKNLPLNEKPVVPTVYSGILSNAMWHIAY
jgi:hypothetical protein